MILLQINVQTSLLDQGERVARRLVIPDNRAISNLKGESEAKSRTEKKKKKKKDFCLPFTFLILSISCYGGEREGK